jgi:hypothetical protein
LHNHLYACITTGSQEEFAVQVVAEPELVEDARSEEHVLELQANEEAGDNLDECPSHHPSSFERGKPQSISPLICKMLY